MSAQESKVSGKETPEWFGGHELKAEQTAWGTVVSARGELDVASVVQLRKHLEAAAGSARVLLDLAAVTFIDSLSLATIVAAKRRLDSDGHLVVVADHPYVLLIFEAGGLDAVVEVFRTRAEAEAHLAA